MILYLKFILTVIVSFAVVGCNSKEIYEPLFPCTKKLTEQYGICNHISRKGKRYDFYTRHQDLASIDSAGAFFLRTDCDWWALKTKVKGELNFQDYDSVVSAVKQHNKHMLGLLTMDGRKELTDDWLDFISQTSNRYRNDIFYWEMLNEVNLLNKWVKGFNMDYYVPFLREGYKVIKKSNPKAKVLFSGIAGVPKEALDSVFSHEVADYFDIMNVHLYTWKKWEPEDFIHNYRRLNDILKKYHLDNKHLWLTETGVQNNLGSEGEKLLDVRLPRVFLISFALGVDKVFWYKARSCELDPNYNEDHFGLWHKDYSPKSAYYAYQTLTKMCPSGSTRPKLMRNGNTFISSWKRPDKKKVWAIWSIEASDTILLDIKGEYKFYDDHGQELSIIKDNLAVSHKVKYIVGAKNVNLLGS